MYYGDELIVRDGYLYGRDDRPRNIMVPCDNLCGLITIIQNCFWPTLKRVVPSFVQGMTKQ